MIRINFFYLARKLVRNQDIIVLDKMVGYFLIEYQIWVAKNQ